MTRIPSASGLGAVLALGSVWGLAEAGLGLGLHGCARLVSGSIMTGVALFFIAAAWARTRRAAGPLLAVGVALAFKLTDAVLLAEPVKSGAIANPMFAFATEGLAFLVVLPFLAARWKDKLPGRAFLGGTAALLAVNLFPFVKLATGIPPCVVPGGTTPLALHYAPIAVGISLLTVPAGIWLGARLESFEAAGAGRFAPLPRRLAAPAAALLCLAAQAALRLI